MRIGPLGEGQTQCQRSVVWQLVQDDDTAGIVQHGEGMVIAPARAGDESYGVTECSDGGREGGIVGGADLAVGKLAGTGELIHREARVILDGEAIQARDELVGDVAILQAARRREARANNPFHRRAFPLRSGHTVGARTHALRYRDSRDAAALTALLVTMHRAR